MFHYLLAMFLGLIGLMVPAYSMQTNNLAFGPVLPPYYKLERHCENEIRRGTIVGASVAVFENGKISFIKSFGLLKKDNTALVNNDTVFQLGSTSKPITASLFAVAAKQKRINLNTPVMLAQTRLQNVEARHILSHTSGFNRNGWNWHIEHGKSRLQLLDLLSKKKQEKPGRIYDYHNVAFSLIEEMLQKAFNMPFESAMRKHLFEPLGMTRTTVGFSKFKEQINIAWPHERTKNGKISLSDSYSYRYHETVPSAGGLNASINDMAKFLQLQLGQFPHLATKKELAPFHSPAVLAPDADDWFKSRINGHFSCHYGYGWRILLHGNEKIVFHGGWLKGFISFIAFSPLSKRGIVVLSNTESSFALSTFIDFFAGKF